jgi:hypothetical protein
MADGEFYHVVRSREQSDHVVKDARTLDISAVLEVELLSLIVLLVQGSSEKTSSAILRSVGIGKS